jgi:hypothetical protein
MSTHHDSEAWRDVPGYEGYYQVSSHGRVKSVERMVKFGNQLRTVRGALLTPLLGSCGHLKVSLSRNSRMRHQYIHRLVLEAFVGSCPDGMECCHFPDRDPSNNRLENLRWGTSKDNAEDMILHGTSGRGERNSAAKLTEAAVLLVRSWSLKGITQKSIAYHFGVSRATIGDILAGRTWRHL